MGFEPTTFCMQEDRQRRETPRNARTDGKGTPHWPLRRRVYAGMRGGSDSEATPSSAECSALARRASGRTPRPSTIEP
jgi:hypothetical protein